MEAISLASVMVNEASSVSMVLKMDEEREAPSEYDEFEENPVPDLEGAIDPDVDVGAGAPRPSLAVRDLPSDLRLDHEISMLARREPIVAGLEDHFTLPTSSNLVRFRSKQNAARVYNEGNFQTILEEEYDPKTATSTISVKRMEDVTAGVTILRISYSVVCALWTGFFFVFCLQVLLFLVLDLAVESGATNINASVNVGTTIGVVLGIIVFVHAFAEALVIAGHYITDTWGGHSLAKQFIFKNLSNVAVDWVFFFAFLLAPLLVMCCTLLMQLENWWAITAITWSVSAKLSQSPTRQAASHSLSVVIWCQCTPKQPPESWTTRLIYSFCSSAIHHLPGSFLSWRSSSYFASMSSISRSTQLGYSARINVTPTVTIFSLF